MQWFSECQITHDVESGEVIHPDHIEFRIRVAFEGISQDRNEFVDVLDEEGLLLF